MPSSLTPLGPVGIKLNHAPPHSCFCTLTACLPSAWKTLPFHQAWPCSAQRSRPRLRPGSPEACSECSSLFSVSSAPQGMISLENNPGEKAPDYNEVYNLHPPQHPEYQCQDTDQARGRHPAGGQAQTPQASSATLMSPVPPWNLEFRQDTGDPTRAPPPPGIQTPG